MAAKLLLSLLPLLTQMCISGFKVRVFSTSPSTSETCSINSTKEEGGCLFNLFSICFFSPCLSCFFVPFYCDPNSKVAGLKYNILVFSFSCWEIKG